MGNRPGSGRYENSPALSVLGSGRDLSSSPCNGRLRWKVSRGLQPDFQPSASRTVSISLPNPSDKSLGYSHSVRFADRSIFVLGETILSHVPQNREAGSSIRSLPLAVAVTAFAQQAWHG